VYKNLNSNKKLNNIKSLSETVVVTEGGIEFVEIVVEVNSLDAEIAVVAEIDSAVVGTGTDSVAVGTAGSDFLQGVELTICACSFEGTPVVFSADLAVNFGIEKIVELAVVEQIAAVVEEQTVAAVVEEQTVAVVEEQTVAVVEEQTVAAVVAGQIAVAVVEEQTVAVQ